MHIKANRLFIVTLLLALVVMPVRALYAQSEMPLVAEKSHVCHQMEKQLQDSSQHAMQCCQQDDMQCNQTCSDCFHCSGITAILSLPHLLIDKSGRGYTLPAGDSYTSLSSSGQFRPPRLII